MRTTHSGTFEKKLSRVRDQHLAIGTQTQNLEYHLHARDGKERRSDTFLRAIFQQFPPELEQKSPPKKKDKIQAIQAFKKNGCVKVPVPFNPITNKLLRILRMPVMSLMMFHAAQWLQVEPGTRVTSKHNFWVTSKHSDLI